MPRVSICIPADREPAMLARCLRSIAEQSFGDYEVIVTDDSPDTAVQEVVEAAGLPITYRRNQPPLGSPGNWNAGLDLASGALIKPMHHDDWFASADALETMVSLLDAAPNAVLACSASRECAPDGGMVRVHRPPASRVDALERQPTLLFADNFLGAPSAVLFRATALRFDTALKWFVDLDFYMHLLRRTGGAVVTTDRDLVCITVDSDARVTAA